MALALCALAVRLLVPAGYMPDEKHFGIVICTGHGPIAAAIVVPHDKSKSSDSGSNPEQLCGFGGVLVGSMPPIDPMILVAALAFIVALVNVSCGALPIRALAWLRPPLRGPPASTLA